MGRAAVLIDGAYLDFTLRDEFNLARIGYELLSQSLTEGLEPLRTYYYHCLPYQSNPPTPEESERFGQRQRFYAALSRLPRYEVRLGELALRGRDDRGQPIFQQKRVDILLGVDLVLLSARRQITHAILVAGDSDYLPAVTAAKNEGVLVRLVHGSVHRPHRDLWDAADERVRLTQELIDRIARPR
jgi:uncharacterized LabA/DUF88 family protein